MSLLKRLSEFIRSSLDLRLLPQQCREITQLLRQSNSMLERLYRVNCEQIRANLQHAARRHNEPPEYLEDFGFKGYSQNDEDGILQEIFHRIGTANRRFVEFGAGSGEENNTTFLACQGWQGLWIDGSEANCKRIHTCWSKAVASGQLRVKQAMLSVENINSVIAEAGFAGEIDLLSIDVDGNDYHLWKAINVIRPRVVVIEYNGFVPPPISWVMPYNPDFFWDGVSIATGASIQALSDLGAELGYRLVCCNKSGLNSFFVRSEFAGAFGEQRTTQQLFHNRKWWHDDYFQSGKPPLGQSLDAAR